MRPAGWTSFVLSFAAMIALAGCSGDAGPGKADLPSTDLCADNPQDPACLGDPCASNPFDVSCRQEDPCAVDPDAPECQEDPCVSDPSVPGCTKTTVDCTKIPTDPRCLAPLTLTDENGDDINRKTFGAMVGRTYTQRIAVGGGTGDYSWDIKTLPEGATWDLAEDGHGIHISWTPEASKKERIKIAVADTATGAFGAVSFYVKVAEGIVLKAFMNGGTAGMLTSEMKPVTIAKERYQPAYRLDSVTIQPWQTFVVETPFVEAATYTFSIDDESAYKIKSGCSLRTMKCSVFFFKGTISASSAGPSVMLTVTNSLGDRATLQFGSITFASETAKDQKTESEETTTFFAPSTKAGEYLNELRIRIWVADFHEAGTDDTVFMQFCTDREYTHCKNIRPFDGNGGNLNRDTQWDVFNLGRFPLGPDATTDYLKYFRIWKDGDDDIFIQGIRITYVSETRDGRGSTQTSQELYSYYNPCVLKGIEPHGTLRFGPNDTAFCTIMKTGDVDAAGTDDMVWAVFETRNSGSNGGSDNGPVLDGLGGLLALYLDYQGQNDFEGNDLTSYGDYLFDCNPFAGPCDDQEKQEKGAWPKTIKVKIVKEENGDDGGWYLEWFDALVFQPARIAKVVNGKETPERLSLVGVGVNEWLSNTKDAGQSLEYGWATLRPMTADRWDVIAFHKIGDCAHDDDLDACEALIP